MLNVNHKYKLNIMYIGYACRADKNPYRHDRRADKNPYRHDRHADKNNYRHDRRADSQCRHLYPPPPHLYGDNRAKVQGNYCLIVPAVPGNYRGFNIGNFTLVRFSVV